ncbi:GNAT family N-acetyltransferase [Actinoplanes sp. NPDC051343]|uniref:GNAT family N-acetyltransferase n=1 Tax=Actinoplanes sp. NPDC051343 TaxID=3363906 RepID=UPI00379FD701
MTALPFAGTALPEGWNVRRPTLDDLPAILAMVQASDMAAVGEADFTPDEVREALTDPGTDMSRDSWVVFDETGTLVGWTYPHNTDGGDRDFIEVYVWPSRGLPAQRPLLEMIMARVAERGAELGHEIYRIRAGAVPIEKDYIELLTEAGFVFNRQHSRMRRSLDGVSPTPPAPPVGVTIRELRHDDEAEMRRFHEVIEDAFRDTDHLAVDYDVWRRQVEAEPTKTWNEWLVALVDDEIAGALQSVDGEDNEGFVRRLAVGRGHRRRGIGEALLRHAFAVYAGNGREKAGLGVDMANPTRAVQLYLAVGLTPLYQANIYERSLDLRV